MSRKNQSPTENSKVNYQNLENTYLAGVYSKRPITLVKGEGVYIWDEKGTYEVKVRVFDTDVKCSEWSEPLEVTVTQGKAKIYQSFQQYFDNFFEKYPNAFPIIRYLILRL